MNPPDGAGPDVGERTLAFLSTALAQPPTPLAGCRHCGQPVAAGGTFCCAGCAGAYALVQGLGLEAYYQRRAIDPRQKPLRPDEAPLPVDYQAYVRLAETGEASLSLMIDGLHCAACVWLIESVLQRQPGVTQARVNMTTRRLTLKWRPEATSAERLADAVTRLGYRLMPYDPACLDAGANRRDRELLRAMAVAGFAFGNVMLLSVSVWAGHVEGMGPATRDLLHWLSALIALPAIVYAGRPFFRSALAALRHGRTNMDVPISLGVLLASAMSLAETMRGAEHAYFDSAIGLLFFLLIGRCLDGRARGQARSSAEHLLALSAVAVTVIDAEGGRALMPPSRVARGTRVLAAVGERIGVDGVVAHGESSIDTSLIDGETTPKTVSPGDSVFAGTLNLGAPLTIRVTAVGEETLLAEIARFVESADRERSRHVALADRVARFYTPFVHTMALVTFLGWWGLADAPWQTALLIAIAVLIVTCPCALALAVPVVQVLAGGRLLRRGVLVKSGTAFERLALVDTVIFDKTGTLTEGHPRLVADGGIDLARLELAAGLAAASRHPLARALVQAYEQGGRRAVVNVAAREIAGQGIEAATGDGVIRLGNRRFCGITGQDDARAPELWLTAPGTPPLRFQFADRPRADAARVVAELKERGLGVELLSGDRAPAVAMVAAAVGIVAWRAEQTPSAKVARLRDLAANGRRVLMVGDGLNDAPALASASVSMSPSTAVDISQVTADVVFQGPLLAPVVETLGVANASRRLAWQNLFLAFLYNGITVPLAVAGLVTPLVAAIAMSTSSLVVIGNALRLNRMRVTWTS